MRDVLLVRAGSAAWNFGTLGRRLPSRMPVDATRSGVPVIVERISESA